MKVTEIHEFYNSDHDGVSNVIVSITNNEGTELEVSIGEGEPEDMYLYRDLADAFSISDLITMAYEAGKAGEDFEYELIEEKDE